MQYLFKFQKQIPIGTAVFKTSLRIFYKNEDKTTEGYKYNDIYYTTGYKKNSLKIFD